MILQALTDYYRRKAADPEATIAPAGVEWKEIPFVLVLTKEGAINNIEDTRAEHNNKRVGKSFLVPQSVKRASNIAANLLWDNAEYALGIDTRGKPERVAQQHTAFRQNLSALLEQLPEDEGLLAVSHFLDDYPLDGLNAQASWAESMTTIRETNPNISFRLVAAMDLVSGSPAVVDLLTHQSRASAAPEEARLCLVSGERTTIARMHAAIKGVKGAQTTGGNIVSFNQTSFTFWGKQQGDNAPVGETAMFEYTTALNHLLRKDSPQRKIIGDTTTVFWAAKADELELAPTLLFGETKPDNPDAYTTAVASLLQTVRNGAYTRSSQPNRFYVLGLAPNAARLAIRNWYVGTVAEMATRIATYFNELELVGKEKFGYPSLNSLLINLAVQRKYSNIPPKLAGEVLRAVLNGTPYPATLLQAVIRRNKAEQRVNYYRAATLKAYLNRFYAKYTLNQLPFKMALDPQNPSLGYNLGRLFAVLEKTQQDANPGLNSTIRDRYFGAASTTPVAVFALLIRLNGHHLSKLNKENRAGLRVNREKLLGEIAQHFQTFPNHLNLHEQGAFAIGYYHQMQDFYTKKEKAETEVAA